MHKCIWIHSRMLHPLQVEHKFKILQTKDLEFTAVEFTAALVLPQKAIFDESSDILFFVRLVTFLFHCLAERSCAAQET